MKYLKKFNEELDPSTYYSASQKLRGMGHSGRAKELEKWADNRKWKDNIEKFSKFGKFKLKVSSSLGDINEDFYLFLIIDRMVFEDELDDFVPNKFGNMFFTIGIIPANEDVLNKCLNIAIEDDFSNGFFWGMIFDLKFIIENDTIKFHDYMLEDYDDTLLGSVSISDRGSAGRFKRLLVKMFSDSKLNYPSGYNDFENFYDMFENFFGAQLGLSSDFGLTPEKVADYIKTISPNALYKSD